MGTVPVLTVRLVEWASRRDEPWTARRAAENMKVPRPDVDEALAWLFAVGRVELVEVEYSGVGRPRAQLWRLV